MITTKRVIQMMAFALAPACSVAVANASVNYQIGNGGLGTFSGTIDGNAISGALAGGILMTEQGAPVSGVPSSYVSVCTDLEGTLYLGQTYTYNSPAASFSNPQQLTGLQPTWGAVNTPGSVSGSGINLANASQAIQNAAYLFYNYGTGGSTLTGNAGISGSTEQLEALQLAVWAALYDTTSSGSVNLVGGRFSITQSSVDSTVWSDVTQWLTALTGDYGYTGYLFQPTDGALNNRNADGQLPQELLYGVNPSGNPHDGVTPIPEPSTIFAGVMLMLPLAAGTIRVLRRKQTA
jgi:hypothetical protein